MLDGMDLLKNLTVLSHLRKLLPEKAKKDEGLGTKEGTRLGRQIDL